jgi:hypothetical protein
MLLCICEQMHRVLRGAADDLGGSAQLYAYFGMSAFWLLLTQQVHCSTT